MKCSLTHILVCSALLALAPSVLAQSSAFTYQGRLLNNGQAAAGNYDFQFVLRDAPVNGTQIGGPLSNAPVQVTNGLFTVPLDFGGEVFDGSSRWLEIGVRTNGSSGPYVILHPLQELTATPYATFSAMAAGLVPGTALTANGANITNLNGAFIQSGTINSNALDTRTAAQLALAGSGSNPTNITGNLTVNGALTVNGSTMTGDLTASGTTSSGRFVTANNTALDNSPNNPGAIVLQRTNDTLEVVQLFMPATGCIGWPDENGLYGGMHIAAMNNHPGTLPHELILWSDQRIAIIPSYGFAQLGHFGPSHDYFCLGSDSSPTVIPSGNSNGLYLRGQSKRLFFAAPYGVGGATTNAYTAMPCIMGFCTDTNLVQVTEPNIEPGGSGTIAYGDLGFFTVPPQFPEPYLDRPATSPGVEMGRMTSKGWKLQGRLTQQQAQLGTFLGQTLLLDFNGPVAQSLTVTRNVSISVTNVPDATHYERHVWFISANPATNVGVVWPASWWRAGTLATNIPRQAMLRVELESLSPSNIVARAEVLSGGTPYVWDADATNYLGRVGIPLSDGRALAVNEFTLATKADGSWTNCIAIYPMIGAVGGAGADFGKNLKGSYYNITWSGSPSMSATGVVFNGSSQYGDTGFNPSSSDTHGVTTFGPSSAHLMCYIENQPVVDNALHELIGCWQLNQTYFALEIAPYAGPTTFFQCYGLNDAYSGGDAAQLNIGAGDPRGTILVTRWNGAVTPVIYVRNAFVSTDTVTVSATGNPNTTVAIGCDHTSGGGYWRYWAGTMAGAAIGGGIPPENASNFITDWETLEQGLGRKVP